MTVLDTNAVSELMLPIPAVQVVEWVSRQAEPAMCFTTISEAELRYGGAVFPTSRRREGLLAGIEGMLREDFDDRILPFNRDDAVVYGGIAAARRDSGQLINHADSQITDIARSVGSRASTPGIPRWRSHPGRCLPR